MKILEFPVRYYCYYGGEGAIGETGWGRGRGRESGGGGVIAILNSTVSNMPVFS